MPDSRAQVFSTRCFLLVKFNGNKGAIEAVIAVTRRVFRVICLPHAAASRRAAGYASKKRDIRDYMNRQTSSGLF